MLNSYQRKSVAIGSFLVLINLFLMWVLTYTPIPQLTLAVFNYLIVGMLVFFGLFFLGTWLIDSGIKYGRMGKAYLG
jgi:uncharacterized membrane protein